MIEVGWVRCLRFTLSKALGFIVAVEASRVASNRKAKSSFSALLQGF